MRKSKRLIAVILTLSFLITLLPQRVLAATNEKLLFHKQILQISNTGVETATDVVVCILLTPLALPSSQIQFEELIDPSPERIETDLYGNRYAYVTFAQLLPGESVSVSIRTNLCSLNWLTSKSDLADLSLLLTGSGDNLVRAPEWTLYLQDEDYIACSNPYMIALAQSLTAGAASDYEKAQLIFDYVNTAMTYDESSVYARQGSLSALFNLRGVCTDFAAFMVALLRAVKIPARIVGGYWFKEPAEIADFQVFSGTNLAHAWVEFYQEGFGWVPADPTQIYYMNGIRLPARQAFASFPTWGHVVYGYGTNMQTYSVKANHFGGAVLTTASSDVFSIKQVLLADEIKVYLNREHRVYFADAAPWIAENNRTYIPLRPLLEAMGVYVEWQAENQQIIAIYHNCRIELQLNSSSMKVNGELRTIDAPAYLDPVNGRTMIPLRAITEAFGAAVQWDARTRSIFIDYFNLGG
ncbi:MAG: hypothetical protein LLG09_01485 [Negativicutes bacterium]|nr:hypothetical protein [Negativicutes bacterium]